MGTAASGLATDAIHATAGDSTAAIEILVTATGVIATSAVIADPPKASAARPGTRLPHPVPTRNKNNSLSLARLPAVLPTLQPRHPPLPQRMEASTGIRVDRWLWAVRVFKTRTLAAAACTAGHVEVNGQPCKPARLIRPGDFIQARSGELVRSVKVVAVLQNRVGAKLIGRYLEDHTPPAEYERARAKPELAQGYRPKGTGRPTKKERRVLGNFFGLDEG